MAQFEYRAPFNPRFVDRAMELRWLDDHILNRKRWSPALIFVCGVTGVGKTAVVQQFLASRRLSDTTVWLDLSSELDPDVAVMKFAHELRTEKLRDSFIVVIDGADQLTDRQIENATHRVLNYKRIRALIFTRQRAPKFDRKQAWLGDRADILVINALPAGDTAVLLQALLRPDVPPEMISQAVAATHGYPLAASLLASTLQSRGPDGLFDVLSGRLYDVTRTVAIPSRKLITSIGPRIVSATEALIEQLRRHPPSVYDLPARKFEELLAELLTDMGWEVELTQATRDGGKDILAYLKTDLGKLLCLVEAKKYRRDHKVGVDLVRTLYGTLCDYQANSAMLVTTSSFTLDAQRFQKKHEYQLSLRDYGDIVQWIQRYKQM